MQLSLWKRTIYRMVKEIKVLSGDLALFAAQSDLPIDAEISDAPPPSGRGFLLRTNNRPSHLPE